MEQLASSMQYSIDKEAIKKFWKEIHEDAYDRPWYNVVNDKNICMSTNDATNVHEGF